MDPEFPNALYHVTSEIPLDPYLKEIIVPEIPPYIKDIIKQQNPF